MANVVKHRFVSAKTDGADASQVQPSHWNDGHLFTGGNAGDLLTRDPTDATFGAKWARASRVTSWTGTGTPSIAADGSANFLVVNSSVDAALHGVAPVSGAFVDGTRLDILNIGTGTVVLVNTSASVANGKFLNHSSGQFATQIKAADAAGGGTAAYIWNGGYWRMVAHEQCGPLSLAFTNANFAGFTATTPVQDFYLHGRDARIRFNANTTVPAQVGSLGITGWPFTFAPGSGHVLPMLTAGTPTHPGWGIDIVVPSAARLDLYLSTSAPWPAGSYTVIFDVTIPIL